MKRSPDIPLLLRTSLPFVGRHATSREQQQQQQRERSGRLVEVASGGKECRRSQAVQVSPEYLKPAASSSSTAAAAVGNFEANSVESSRCSLAGEAGGAWSGSLVGEEEGTAVACAVGEGGARGDGNRRLLRWRSIRRLQQNKSTISSGDVSGKSTVDFRGKSMAACASSTQSPSRLSLGRRGKGSTTAASTTGTVVAPAPTPAATRSPDVCLSRRTIPPQQRGGSPDDHLATGSGNASPDSKAVGDNNNSTTAVAAVAAVSLVIASLDDEKARKPECLVPSVLVSDDNGGGGDGSGREPLSPATSIASEGGSAPGWAERAGLSGGVAVTATSRTAGGRSRAPSKRRSRLGKECPVVYDDDLSPPARAMPPPAKNSGDREVPRFLRPVIVLLTLSLLAIGGATLLQEARRRRAAAGEGWAVGSGGGGVVLFGPAAFAAGGVQLPEAVVDDIFERADKDKNGVIGDEEIQYVS